MKTYLCRMEELRKGKPRLVRAGTRKLAVWTDGSDVVVFEPFCPHARANLMHGRYHDHTVRCHWHGWQFDLLTGAGINNDSCLKVIPSEVRNEAVYALMGEPVQEMDAEPDDELMPEIRWKNES